MKTERWSAAGRRARSGYPAGTSSRDRTGTGKAAPSPLLAAGAGPDSARRPIGCDPPRRSCPDRARRRRSRKPGGPGAGSGSCCRCSRRGGGCDAFHEIEGDHGPVRRARRATAVHPRTRPRGPPCGRPREPKPQHEPLGLDAALQTLARTCRGPRPPRTASWRRSPGRSPPGMRYAPTLTLPLARSARPRKTGPGREEARVGERVTYAGQGRRRYECGPGGHPAGPAAGLAPVGVVVQSLSRARPTGLRTFRGPARRGRYRPRSGPRRSRPWPGPRGARGPRRRVSAVRRCAFRGPVRAGRPA
ncbi:hypothetical protein GA0115252_135811 [Streptomyces sp. DfronAA-171]|nr:hypothetical protein GA0115252_135811 [Streptomyces sp. DfronAA-171]